MKEDLQTLKKIRDTVVGLKMQLDLIYGDLKTVTEDLVHMHIVKQDFIDNIEVLKQDKIVAMMFEYRRSVEGLEQIEKKISQWTNKKRMLEKRKEAKLKAYESNMREFENLKRVLDNRKVILLFDPNKKRKKS